MVAMYTRANAYVSRAADLIGRVLRTDGRYLLSGGFWSLMGQGAAILSSLALAVIVSRFVPKDVYGNYKYVLAVVGMFSILSLNNLSTAVFQSVSKGFEGSMFEGFRVNLRWSGLVFLAAIAVCAYYAFAGNVALAFCILLGGCAMPLQSSANLFISFLGAKQQFARRTIYADVLGNIVPAVALILTAIYFPSLIALVCVYFLSNLAVDLFFYLRTVSLYRPDPTRIDPGMTRYGFHLSAIGILGGIVGNIDQILLFHFAGAIDLAVYSFAIGILDQIKGPAKMLDSMMQARFASRERSDIDSGMGNKMLWMFVASLVVIAAFWFAAPVLYGTFFPTYIASLAYARLYSFNLLGLAAIPVGSYFSSHKKIKEQYIATAGGNLITIVFMFVGVVVWGLWGLIAARIAASLVTGVLSIILYLHATEAAIGLDA